MEGIEKISLEIQQLLQQEKEKKQDLIKAKLMEIQENGISNQTNLSPDEIVMLRSFLIDHGNPKSTWIQKEWHYDFDYEDDFIDCYILIGDKVYSISDNTFINRNNIKKDYSRDDFSNGRKTLVGSKRQLTESLDINQLFGGEKGINCEADIEKINEELQQLSQQINEKKQELIKVKLRDIQENGITENSRLTKDEIEELSRFIMENGNPNSAMVQLEWDMDYVSELQNNAIECYLMLKDRLYSVSQNRYISKKYIPNDTDLSYDSGVETLFGNKEQLTEPFNIDELFFDDRNKESKQSSQEETPRQIFENSLVRDDIVEFFKSKTPEELEQQLGAEVARMVGFEQKNSHHCYDLWEHTLRTVEGIKPIGLTPDQFKKLRVAAFFHDIGKPDVSSFNPRTGQQVFYAHAHHSVDVAKPILEGLGYSKEEIEQLSFYIAHHDDFISYKSKLAPFMQNHEFIRGISPETIAEKVIENRFDFQAMGYNKDEIRAIVYTLAHRQEPDFRTKDGPISIPINIQEVKAKINSGEYNSSYDASLDDYQMLLKLCRADAGAQSEIAERTTPNGKKVIDGTKAEKLENMSNIEEAMPLAYIQSILYSKNRLQRYKKLKEDISRKNDKAKSLLSEYSELLETRDNDRKNK